MLEYRRDGVQLQCCDASFARFNTFRRQAVDWLATRKFSLYMPSQGAGIYKAKNQGLPVDTFNPYHFKEGVNLSSAFGSLALMNRAPHPNAAKVFVTRPYSKK